MRTTNSTRHQNRPAQLTDAQLHLISSLEAQAKAAAEHPGTYSRGFVPGTVGCHKTVAASLVKMGLLVTKRSALHGQIVDLAEASTSRQAA